MDLYPAHRLVREARRTKAKTGRFCQFEFYDLNVRYDFMDFVSLLGIGYKWYQRAAGKEKHLVCMDCITILTLFCHICWCSIMEEGNKKVRKDSDGIGGFGRE